METRAKFKKSLRNESVDSRNRDHPVTIHTLNDDCLTNIFTFLRIVDRVRIERVCKHWRNISKNSWQNIKTLNSSFEIWGIHIVNCYPNEKSILEKVLKRCGSFLCHLDLSGFFMKSYILHSVGNLCPNLQYIDMQSITLTLPAIKILTKKCHNLKEIAFGNSTMACNDTPLSEFFSRNKQLQSLKMTKNYAMNGQFLQGLPADMDTIIIECCSLQYLNYLCHALKHFRQLKTFSFMNSICSFGSRFLIEEDLESLTTLKSLKISKCTFITINCIIKMTDLEKLVMFELEEVTDAFLLTLVAECKKLHHVDITKCYNVTDVGIQALTSLPEIEYLNLNYLYKITGYTLTYMPKLKQLYCKDCCNLKDDGLRTLLATCDLIEVLDLCGCSQITNYLVKSAISAAKNRTNNIVLNLILLRTAVDPTYFCEKYLRLEIILPFIYESSSEDDDWLSSVWYDTL